MFGLILKSNHVEQAFPIDLAAALHNEPTNIVSNLQFSSLVSWKYWYLLLTQETDFAKRCTTSPLFLIVSVFGRDV